MPEECRQQELRTAGTEPGVRMPGSALAAQSITAKEVITPNPTWRPDRHWSRPSQFAESLILILKTNYAPLVVPAPLAGAFFIPSPASCAPYTKTDTIATIKLTQSYHHACQEKEASKEKASDCQRLRQEFTR